MGWLQRMFGKQAPAPAGAAAAPDASIPPERVGLSGEYDESGLAKRVALAFDNDPTLDDIETLWVAQTSSTVVLKGQVPSQEILNKMTAIAGGVEGATDVDVSQVTAG